MDDPSAANESMLYKASVVNLVSKTPSNLISSKEI